LTGESARRDRAETSASRCKSETRPEREKGQHEKPNPGRKKKKRTEIKTENLCQRPRAGPRTGKECAPNPEISSPPKKKKDAYVKGTILKTD